jgi:hypothetical protein
VFTQEYTIVKIGDTGYYLNVKRNTIKRGTLRFEDYCESVLSGSLRVVDEKITFPAGFELWNYIAEGDHETYGVIYFSGSSQSDFVNRTIIRRVNINILNIDNICNIYKFSKQFGRQHGYLGDWTLDIYIGEIIIYDNEKYIHIIARAVSEGTLMHIINNWFSTLRK